MTGMIGCPNCGKLTEAQLANCPHCGYIQKPSAGVRGRVKGAASAGGERCPSCGADVRPSDIICVACGTNLLTKEKVTEERVQGLRGAERPALRWIAGGLVAALVLAAAGFVLYWLSRDPVNEARELCRVNNFIDAKEVLTKYLEKHGQDAQAHLLLGRIHWRMNQFDAAADAFDTAAKFDRTSPEPLLMAALSLASATGQDTLPRQANLLRDAVNAFPNDARAAQLLAAVLGMQGDVAGQAEVLRKVIAADPANGGAQRNLAVALLEQGDYSAAGQALDIAKSSGADDADTAVLRALLDDSQDKPEALDEYRGAIEARCHPRKEVLTRLGSLLVSQGRFDEAAPYLKEVVDDGGGGDARAATFFYAICLEARGADVDALDRFSELCRTPGQYTGEAAQHVANLYLNRGDVDNARQALDRVQVTGDNAALDTLRGRIAMRDGRLDDAQAAFLRAIRTDASYAPAYIESGLAYVKKEAFEEAITALETYLKLADPSVGGTRTTEVRALVDQLKQTAHAGGAPRAEAYPPVERSPQ